MTGTRTSHGVGAGAECRAGSVRADTGPRLSPPQKVRSQFPAFHSNFLQLQWLPAALLIANKYKGSSAQNRKQRNLPSSIKHNEPLQAEKLQFAGPALSTGHRLGQALAAVCPSSSSKGSLVLEASPGLSCSSPCCPAPLPAAGHRLVPQDVAEPCTPQGLLPLCPAPG